MQKNTAKIKSFTVDGKYNHSALKPLPSNSRNEPPLPPGFNIGKVRGGGGHFSGDPSVPILDPGGRGDAN